MKTYMTLAIVLALAVAGHFLRAGASRAGEEKDDAAQPTAIAEKGDLSITVSATGRVEAEREVEIKSKASGEVVKINADVSDSVKQGQLLFKLDPTDEERSVAKLRAGLAMSQAKLEQTRLAVQAAEAKLAADTARANAQLASARAERDEYQSRRRRAEELFAQKVINREELDTAVTKAVQTESALANAQTMQDDLKVQAFDLDRTRQDIHISRAQVENDNVALEDALQRLKETEVFAPINGVVSERSIQEGFIVASGVSNVGGGTTAMKLIDLSRIYAIAAVDEADISGVVPGIKAEITADAYKGRTFPGKVVRVAATGLVDSNVVTFDVKVEIEGRHKGLLKPEMTTNVLFLVDERKDVVLVPASAVVRKAVRVDAPAPSAPAAGGTPAPAVGATAQPADGDAGQPTRAGRVDYTRRQAYVTVVKADGTEEERPVQAGISDGSMIEIASGLEVGERVMLQEAAESRWAGQGQRRRGPRL